MNSFCVCVAPAICLLITGVATGQESINISAGGFKGTLHDNVSNRDRQGSGFHPLMLKAFPNASLFRDDAVGLNFEHIFNGAADDRDIAMFTPRQDACNVARIDEQTLRLSWPGKGTAWGLDAHMDYRFSGPGQIDLSFACRPSKDKFPAGYVAMMWASYMGKTVDRRIHFWGTANGQAGWVSFGDTVGDVIEVGTVAYSKSQPLPFEPKSQSLNIAENTAKKFTLPFYYGIIDADRDLSTTMDRHLFLVLFDQTDSIRFAMWNFFKNDAGTPDTHSPAWDWQYVIRDPQVGKTYGYRARVVIKPYEGKEQVWAEYQKWNRDLGHQLPTRP